jgi:hypothetical protein
VITNDKELIATTIPVNAFIEFVDPIIAADDAKNNDMKPNTAVIPLKAFIALAGI